MDWLDAPWLGFDTETTGVDPERDRLVTAALVRRDGGAGASAPDEVRTWLADPGVEIPERASAVHGITTERARAEGRDAVEVLEEVASVLVEHWRYGCPVVVFNAPYDLTLLDAELSRHGLPGLDARLGGAALLVLDPLVLDRALDPRRRGKRTLTTMAPVYGVAAREDAHSADADVAMTLDVLAAMAGRYEALASEKLLALQGHQARAHAAWAEEFEAWLRSQGRGDVIDRRWPRH